MARKSGELVGESGLVARNRRAGFDYELGDAYEAGIALQGSEVRALREGKADLTDAWVGIQRGEAFVENLRIPPLAHATSGHEERRRRKLLLHKHEIERIQSASERDGMTLIATKLYFKQNRAKIEIVVARGKKKHDKRRAIQAKDEARDARRGTRDR